MSLIAQLIVATFFIVAFIVLRMVAERWVLRTRLKDHQPECEETACFRTCDRGGALKDTKNRSAHNAP